jgi:hypothetical protein
MAPDDLLAWAAGAREIASALRRISRETCERSETIRASSRALRNGADDPAPPPSVRQGSVESY